MAIKIIGAAYGTTGKGNDVTAICQALVDNGNDDIPVNNQIMGPDPAPGHTKYFGIVFQRPNGDGQYDPPVALAAKEGDVLDLAPIPAIETADAGD